VLDRSFVQVTTATHWRKVQSTHVQRVAYAYKPLYIKIVGTISC
jgi:hypothetical protein